MPRGMRGIFYKRALPFPLLLPNPSTISNREKYWLVLMKLCIELQQRTHSPQLSAVSASESKIR
jgi:hypothetical protein